jgi:hypothetical protein
LIEKQKSFSGTTGKKGGRYEKITVDESVGCDRPFFGL